MEQRREQFECSYCGDRFNFKKEAEEHEKQCPKRKTDTPPQNVTATGALNGRLDRSEVQYGE